MDFQQLTPQQILLWNNGRAEADRQFGIKDELLMEANAEKDKKKQKYLFDQAAMRDTKARIILDNLKKQIENTRLATFSEVVAHFRTIKTPVDMSNRVMYRPTWWRTWVTNFVN